MRNEGVLAILLASVYLALKGQKAAAVTRRAVAWVLPGNPRDRVVTSPFGVRPPVRDADGNVVPGSTVDHKGVDYRASVGTPVTAPCDATVTLAWKNGADGLAVYLADPTGWLWRFVHLSEIEVTLGQNVARGDLLGYSGGTGAVNAPNLHVGVRVPTSGGETEHRDPEQVLDWKSPDELVENGGDLLWEFEVKS